MESTHSEMSKIPSEGIDTEEMEVEPRPPRLVTPFQQFRALVGRDHWLY